MADPLADNLDVLLEIAQELGADYCETSPCPGGVAFVAFFPFPPYPTGETNMDTDSLHYLLVDEDKVVVIDDPSSLPAGDPVKLLLSVLMTLAESEFEAADGLSLKLSFGGYSIKLRAISV